MKEFDSFMDLTGKNRKLKCCYHGKHTSLRLEARILFETSQELVVSVSILSDEIHSDNYDPLRKSLDIWYQKKYKIIAGLPDERFQVPKDIKEINVYDI